jgi:hypothetical protein
MRGLAAVLFTCVVACTAEEPPPETFGDGLGTPDNPIPDEEQTYDVTTRVELASTPQVQDAIASMKAFAQNPARTLLSMADQTAVQQLKSQIGTTLSNNLESWINTEIDKVRISTKTMRQVSTDLATIAETTLTKFNLESKLDMTPAKTTHSLSGLNFRPLTVDIVVLIGGMAADKLTQHPTLAVAPAGAITLGEQTFGLAFGDHAWSGINLASSTLFGSNVPATFTAGINCSKLADTIATKCSSGSCVGHASQLHAICEGGTNAIVEQLHEHISGVTLELFRYVGGNARLVDENGDGLADRILEGSWDAELNLGAGVTKPKATFEAY